MICGYGQYSVQRLCRGTTFVPDYMSRRHAQTAANRIHSCVSVYFYHILYPRPNKATQKNVDAILFEMWGFGGLYHAGGVPKLVMFFVIYCGPSSNSGQQ
eukprot:5842679-Amphidinium_carterae.1